MYIFDITPTLSSRIAVWPGDVPFERKVTQSIFEGSNIELSSMSTTVHVGAHADAPLHFDKQGACIASVSLEPYIGPCAVVLTKDFPLITEQTAKMAVETGQKRLLFRTDSYPDANNFTENFCAFAPEAMEIIGRANCLLVGIDTPSIDPFSSKELPAHHKLKHYGMRNLEGLILKDIPQGVYELIALPLKILGFDASPVRAILRK